MRVTRCFKCAVQSVCAEKGKINRHDIQLPACLLSSAPFRLFAWMIRVRQYRHSAQPWKNVFQQLNPFARQIERKERGPREIAARLPEALDETQGYRVPAQGKQDRNICYRCHCASCGTARYSKVYVAAAQFGYHLPQPLRIAGCIVQLESNVLTLGVAQRTQSFSKPVQKGIGLGFS